MPKDGQTGDSVRSPRFPSVFSVYHTNRGVTRNMMTKERIESILRRIKYLDWQFRVGGGGAEGPLWIQCVFRAPGIEDTVPRYQHGRKWLISGHAVGSEVVKTAWLAVQTAIEHEARECFRFDGEAIFGPHIDVGALHSVSRVHERRPPPPMVG